MKTGKNSQTGFRSVATNMDDYSEATNEGGYSLSASTGDGSKATNTGFRSSAINTGDRSYAEVAGDGSVAIVTGSKSCAKAGLGSAIVVVERGEFNGKTYPLLNIKAAIVDGEKIKANTWYMLRNGEFQEVKRW